MAFTGGGNPDDITGLAAASLKTTTSQYTCVIVSGTNTFAMATASTQKVIGIQQNYLSSGSETCRVRVRGFSKATCVSTVTAGDWIVAGALGGVAATTQTAVDTTTAFAGIVGYAFESGVTNSVISVYVNPFRRG